jgi:propanediol dehydratase medium subunit
LAALTRGVREEGLVLRLVRVRATADCGALGHEASRLAGSGIGIGLQSKGTAVIHRRGLAPLDNLELFSQAPALTLDSYAAIGRNAARHAKGEPPSPVPVRVDNMARLRLIVPTLLMHKAELAAVVPNAPPLEVAPHHD